MRFKSIFEIKRKNRFIGRYFFSPGALDFFDSIVYSEVFNGKYFITSERNKYCPRLYTIREALSNGTIKTVGKFQQHRTKAAAEEAVVYME